MNWEALFAYLHYAAIFALAGAMLVEYALLRQPDLNPFVNMLARTDLIYGIAAVAVLATGLTRLFAYGKGLDWYMGTWLMHLKLSLFVLVALVSIVPTLRFIQWKKRLAAGGSVAPGEQRGMRLLVLLQMHVVFLLPLLGVLIARGYGRPG